MPHSDSLHSLLRFNDGEIEIGDQTLRPCSTPSPAPRTTAPPHRPQPRALSQFTAADSESNQNFKYDKVVFLDVDGVLHATDVYREEDLFLADKMANLKEIVDATGCKVVLSSTWRTTTKSTARVNKELRSAGIPACVCATAQKFPEEQRDLEIKAWLQENPARRWVAIDDLPMFQLREHYIGIIPEDGLTKNDAQRAIRILNGLMSGNKRPMEV